MLSQPEYLRCFASAIERKLLWLVAVDELHLYVHFASSFRESFQKLKTHFSLVYILKSNVLATLFSCTFWSFEKVAVSLSTAAVSLSRALRPQDEDSKFNRNIYKFS